jgi:cyclic pyranopterin phosphate synthase
MSIALPVLPPRRARAAGAPPAAPARARAEPAGRLVDSHGRVIRDLRLSITDRCNFRCVYCMDPDVRFMDADELLHVDELVRVARVGAALGVRKVRLTGGEPAVHPRLTDIIAGVAALPVEDVAITTNGSLMEEARLRAWRDAGLGRVTVSLDSVRPERFAAVTRSRTPPRRVIDGIAAARRVGFNAVKVNAVIVRGYNDDEVVPLAGLSRELGVEVRFIEFMPLDSAHAWDRSRVVPADEIVRRVGAAWPLRPLGRDDESSTALTWEFADGAPGRIGVIAPVTRPFCGACSRLRITADGKVRPCLFSTREWDLRPLLRAGAGDDALADFLVDATWTKQAGHGISSAGFVQPERPMSAIGG